MHATSSTRLHALLSSEIIVQSVVSISIVGDSRIHLDQWHGQDFGIGGTLTFFDRKVLTSKKRSSSHILETLLSSAIKCVFLDLVLLLPLHIIYWFGTNLTTSPGPNRGSGLLLPPGYASDLDLVFFEKLRWQQTS